MARYLTIRRMKIPLMLSLQPQSTQGLSMLANAGDHAVPPEEGMCQSH